MNICKRCGRKLKNKKSQEQGYGNSCFKKMKQEATKTTTLEEFDV